MTKLCSLVMMLAILAASGAVDAAPKAKEKANKTKCSSKLRNIGSSGQDGVAQPARALIPTILRLQKAGNTAAAMILTESGIRQTRHRGHVTVLKLQATMEQCIEKMQRDGDSREDIAYIKKLGTQLIKQIKRATAFHVDSFFDIWTEI